MEQVLDLVKFTRYLQNTDSRIVSKLIERVDFISLVVVVVVPFSCE